MHKNGWFLPAFFMPFYFLTDGSVMRTTKPVAWDNAYVTAPKSSFRLKQYRSDNREMF